MEWKIISELYEFMKNLMDEQDLDEFLKCDMEEISRYHFSLGLWLRNNVLKNDGEIYVLFNESGITDKDEMSKLLTEGFYIYLKLR